MKILPLGSVLAYQGVKRYVVGYRVIQEEDILLLAYTVIPYPLGYQEAESYRFIPVNEELEMIQEGYTTELSEMLCGQKLELVQKLSQITPKEYEEAWIEMENQLERVRAKEGER